MRKRDRQLIELSRRLDTLGISLSDQEALRRIEMTLHRWAEQECNGNIQREGENADGAPRWINQGALMPLGLDGKGYRIADRERGALKRLAAIMSKYPALWYYHQGDPRGCALYVGRWADIPGPVCAVEYPDQKSALAAAARMLDGYYTRGVAVCL